MLENISPSIETKVNFVVNAAKIVGIWPDIYSTRKSYIISEIKWSLFILNLIGILGSISFCIYNNISKPLIATKAVGEFIILFETLMNLIIWRRQKYRLQIVFIEFMNFLETATQEEKKILNNHVQTFPLIVATNIISMHLMAMVLYNALMKIEILKNELENVDSREKMLLCIEKHQNCIEYVEQLNLKLRFLILKGFFTRGISIIVGITPLIYSNNIIEISQALLFFINVMTNNFIITGPADDIHEAGQNISLAIYSNTRWITNSKKMCKESLIIMCRAQRPLSIFVHGILPALTRKFYASFLSFTLSYTATLRAILQKD